MMIILGSVMAVLLMVGVHRRSEALGLTELQLSTGIARAAPARAAIVSTAIASLILGAGSTAVLAASGTYVEEMPLDGALASGAVIALTAFGSAVLAHLVLLFVGNAAALTRAALFTIAASFALRSLADSEGWDWLNWVSPLGWKTQVRPYVDNDWTALTIIALICVAGATALLLAERRREYGAALVRLPSLLPSRTRRIQGPLHLAGVLYRATIGAWVAVIAGLNGFFIALTGSLTEWMEAEESVGKIFDDIFGGGDMKTEFIYYILKLMGILIATMGVQILVSYRSAEVDRTVDLQRSTGLRRWIPHAAATVLAVLGILAATVGAHVGGAVGLWTQETTVADDYQSLLTATWSQLAPSLLLAGIAVLLVGWVPRFIHVAWAPVVVAAILTLFGPVLNAPQWLIDLSPFEYVDQWGAQGAMGIGAVALIVLGLVGSQRRDIR